MVETCFIISISSGWKWYIIDVLKNELMEMQGGKKFSHFPLLNGH